MAGYRLPPMPNFPPGTPSTQISEMVRKTPANPTPQLPKYAEELIRCARMYSGA
jgi:hypothetical protein